MSCITIFARLSRSARDASVAVTFATAKLISRTRDTSRCCCCAIPSVCCCIIDPWDLDGLLNCRVPSSPTVAGLEGRGIGLAAAVGGSIGCCLAVVEAGNVAAGGGNTALLGGMKVAPNPAGDTNPVAANGKTLALLIAVE